MHHLQGTRQGHNRILIHCLDERISNNNNHNIIQKRAVFSLASHPPLQAFIPCTISTLELLCAKCTVIIHSSYPDKTSQSNDIYHQEGQNRMQGNRFPPTHAPYCYGGKKHSSSPVAGSELCPNSTMVLLSPPKELLRFKITTHYHIIRDNNIYGQ